MKQSEMPKTKQGIITYAAYCEAELKWCDSLKKKMYSRLEWCEKKLKEYSCYTDKPLGDGE